MNKIIKLLYELGISGKNSLKIYHQSVRDNENIKVLKCKKSGVFVLDDILTNKKYYEKNIIYSEKKETTHTIDKIIGSEPLEDDVRIFEQNKLKFEFDLEETGPGPSAESHIDQLNHAWETLKTFLVDKYDMWATKTYIRPDDAKCSGWWWLDHILWDIANHSGQAKYLKRIIP